LSSSLANNPEATCTLAGVKLGTIAILAPIAPIMRVNRLGADGAEEVVVGSARHSGWSSRTPDHVGVVCQLRRR
jgi:hypothetical protein